MKVKLDKCHLIFSGRDARNNQYCWIHYWNDWHRQLYLNTQKKSTYFSDWTASSVSGFLLALNEVFWFCEETSYNLTYQQSIRVTSVNKDIVFYDLDTALFLQLWVKYLQKVKKIKQN